MHLSNPGQSGSYQKTKYNIIVRSENWIQKKINKIYNTLNSKIKQPSQYVHTVCTVRQKLLMYEQVKLHERCFSTGADVISREQLLHPNYTLGLLFKNAILRIFSLIMRFALHKKLKCFTILTLDGALFKH